MTNFEKGALDFQDFFSATYLDEEDSINPMECLELVSGAIVGGIEIMRTAHDEVGMEAHPLICLAEAVVSQDKPLNELTTQDILKVLEQIKTSADIIIEANKGEEE